MGGVGDEGMSEEAGRRYPRLINKSAVRDRHNVSRRGERGHQEGRPG